jgi:hypothetical protein
VTNAQLLAKVECLNGVLYIHFLEIYLQFDQILAFVHSFLAKNAHIVIIIKTNTQKSHDTVPLSCHISDGKLAVYFWQLGVSDQTGREKGNTLCDSVQCYQVLPKFSGQPSEKIRPITEKIRPVTEMMEKAS